MEVVPRIILIPEVCTEEDLRVALRNGSNVAVGDVGGRLELLTRSSPLAERIRKRSGDDPRIEYIGSCRCNCGTEIFGISNVSIKEAFAVLGPMLAI